MQACTALRRCWRIWRAACGATLTRFRPTPPSPCAWDAALFQNRNMAAMQPERLGAQARTALRRALAELAGCAQRNVALTGVRRLVTKSGPPGVLVLATAALGADPAAAQQLVAQLREVCASAVRPVAALNNAKRV